MIDKWEKVSMPNRDKALITVVVLITVAILISENHGVLAAGGSDLGSFDRSFTVSGPVQLNIENSSGSVNVRRGGSDKVDIHALIRSSNWFGDTKDQAQKIMQNPPVEQSANTIRIYRPEPHDWFNHVSISYEITVPEETTVNSATGSGSQTVASVKGPVTVKSGSGSVTVTDIGAQAEATTGSGSITFQSVNGPAKAQTGSGSVHADGIAGAFRVRTGSGGINVRQTAPGDVDAETGSGHIVIENVTGGVTAHAGSGSIRVDGRPTSEWNVHSGSGSIDLRVAGDQGLDLYARTSSGSVDVDSPITLDGGQINRHEVRGKIRGGGTRLEATTGSGTIHIQ
jgi:DUF4097 and DUF4098 domain-containing protein YvlB